MFLKWTFIAFGVATVAIYVLAKVLGVLNPPRPGRPAPPMLRTVERTLRWMVLIPFALALAMLVIALSGRP
jgi:hypothetical protein